MRRLCSPPQAVPFLEAEASSDDLILEGPPLPTRTCATVLRSEARTVWLELESGERKAGHLASHTRVVPPAKGPLGSLEGLAALMVGWQRVVSIWADIDGGSAHGSRDEFEIHATEHGFEITVRNTSLAGGFLLDRLIETWPFIVLPS